MNNKKTDFYGKFEFNGKKYPFHYEDSFVTVIQEPWEYNKDFENESFVEKITGLTNSNKIITFLKCEFIGGDYKEIYNNIIFSTQGFVLFGKDEFPFAALNLNQKH